jgi:hypothetical protein
MYLAFFPPVASNPGAPRGRSVRRLAWILATGWMLGLSLTACSHAQPQIPACETGEPGGVKQPSLRLMVGFQTATAGDSTAVIEQLQSRTGACVRFVSSVSPTLHVYVLAGAADTQTVRQQLLQWSAISQVDADARMDKH